MSFIKVTSDDLTSTASQLNNVASQIESESSAAMSQVNALVGAGWQGAASASFEGAMANWQSGAAQIQQALATISSLLNSAAGQYDATESSIASSFNG